MSEDTVILRVRALETMSLEEVRSEWRRRLGAPPRLRSPDTLRRLLAWRLQVDAWGGLDDVTRRRLRGTGRPKDVELSPGSEVTREWDGAVHAVQVVEGAFVYAGVTYASLSAIALAITGVKWNGPRFFGLRPARRP